MNFEQQQNPEGEKIEKETVLEMLKINGFEHPETKELMIKFIEQREKDVTGTHEGILLELDRSDLFAAAQMNDESFKSLEDALEQADQENDIGLQDKIIARLKAFRIEHPQLVKEQATFPLLPEEKE